MREAIVLQLQASPLILGEGQGREFPHLPLKLFAFALKRFRAARRQLQSGGGVAPEPVACRHLLRTGGQSGMAVEQRALRIGAQERLVGMLTMNIDEKLADLAQLLGGRRRAVDVAARAPTDRKSVV